MDKLEQSVTFLQICRSNEQFLKELAAVLESENNVMVYDDLPAELFMETDFSPISDGSDTVEHDGRYIQVIGIE